MAIVLSNIPKKAFKWSYNDSLFEQQKLWDNAHSVKSALIRNCTGPYFPAFRLNTEMYGVNFFIKSESR